LACCDSAGFGAGTGTGFTGGAFNPPNKLFAMFCLALSSGAINFFFSLTGEATGATTIDGFVYFC